MTFYYGSGSPFAWRVWLTLEHKQLAHELRLMSFSSGDLRSEEFAGLNPRRKVPVLVDDGFVLYESAAIVEYLDDRYPRHGAGRVFPEDARERALTRRVILEADQYLSPGTRPLLNEVFSKPAQQRDPAIIAQGRERLEEELGYLERLVRGDFLLGALTAADFTVYPMLALIVRLDQRFALLDLDELVGPQTRRWMERVENLPYFAKTLPPHWKSP
jgi:glutathione S-transferase